MKKIFIAFFVILMAISSNSNANEYQISNMADDHAPIGVTRDHIHKKGEIMASYRFSYAQMKGLRNGNDRLKTADVLSGYMMAPVKMTMKMHMIGAMYGISDQLTFSTMASIIEKDAENVNKMAKNSKRSTADVGDTKINGSYGFFNNDYGKSQFNLALSLPTGNINKKHNNVSLPYSMQIGSGSYELLPGISYSGHSSLFSYGGQINGNFRLNSNDNGYKLGNNYNVTSWIAARLNNSLSISSRLDYNKYEAIKGNDVTLLNQLMMMPAANGSLYDKQRLDLLFGTNFLMPNGFLKGNRIAIEFGVPIYQKIYGPMLEDDYKFTIGWQNIF